LIISTLISIATVFMLGGREIYGGLDRSLCSFNGVHLIVGIL